MLNPILQIISYTSFAYLFLFIKDCKKVVIKVKIVNALAKKRLIELLDLVNFIIYNSIQFI